MKQNCFLSRVKTALHYPRNTILFGEPLTGSAVDLDRAAMEWAVGNYVRIAVILAALVLAMVSMIRIARDTTPGEHRCFSSCGMP